MVEVASSVGVLVRRDLYDGFVVHVEEHVLWSVHISAEGEVVDFAGVALVQVLPNDEVEYLIIARVNAEILEHSLELLVSHVAGLCSIEVLKAGL